MAQSFVYFLVQGMETALFFPDQGSRPFKAVGILAFSKGQSKGKLEYVGKGPFIPRRRIIFVIIIKKNMKTAILPSAWQCLENGHTPSAWQCLLFTFSSS